MSGKRVLLVMLVSAVASVVNGQLNIDLSTAALDPDTGNYCVVQKVCITNPPESLTSAGCAPSAPPGCECDPAQPADLFCAAGETCSAANCQCLRAGCDCDPNSSDPDSFCPIDEVCKDDCSCGSELPAGCDCAGDEDCNGDARCVACVCQDCPASSPRSQVFNPPLVFVIDTTKSVKPDKDSIFNLTMKVVENIKKDNINIPRYQLVTFNDFGPDIRRNVKLELDTGNVEEFGRKTAGIKFESYNGGRDSKERLTQGLYIALQNAMPKSLVVVFTDNGSKNLNLEKEIVRIREEKEIEVYIVLTPEYEGRKNGKSLPVYNRLGKVFLISDVGANNFLQSVEEYEETNCV
eukprot:TRINITY_DN18212_c0_g1_i1.p1 TRINITY_DN18212_c0_g1~~TRINITY_DN18212_c0_g1_i1.p1  ORF type:complete len:350 (-),score=101.88 TRINITY_DN18212_c0_g1_i1:245-1294(-)